MDCRGAIMDSMKLTMQGSSSRKSHRSDDIAFTIKPYGVAPPTPWGTILGLLILGGILYVVFKR